MSEKAPTTSREEYLADNPNVSGDQLIDNADVAEDMARAADPYREQARTTADEYYQLLDREAQRQGVASHEQVRQNGLTEMLIKPVGQRALDLLERGGMEEEVARMTHEDPEAAVALRGKLDAEDAAKQREIDRASRIQQARGAFDDTQSRSGSFI